MKNFELVYAFMWSFPFRYEEHDAECFTITHIKHDGRIETLLHKEGIFLMDEFETDSLFLQLLITEDFILKAHTVVNK